MASMTEILVLVRTKMSQRHEMYETALVPLPRMPCGAVPA
jgi:hypothetical protein